MASNRARTEFHSLSRNLLLLSLSITTCVVTTTWCWRLLVDLRKSPLTQTPLSILNNTVSIVDVFKFLGSTISQDLKWIFHINIVWKRVLQRLYFLQQLRNSNLPQGLLTPLLLHHHHSVCPLHFHHWFCSATQPELCREDHWDWPDHHPGPGLVHCQETGR